MVISNAEGVHQGFVAWSDLSDDGEWVEVVPEIEWWAHVLLGHRPLTVLRWPSGAAWVE